MKDAEEVLLRLPLSPPLPLHSIHLHPGCAFLLLNHSLAEAIEAENQCSRSQTRLLIDQISSQQGRIDSLEGENESSRSGMRTVESTCSRPPKYDYVAPSLYLPGFPAMNVAGKGFEKLVGDARVPVAAVVVMACNHADYLDRTIKSIQKYQSPIAARYPLFISQDGSDPHVKSKGLSYDQLIYMQCGRSDIAVVFAQHLDFEPVHTELPGDLITYYKIARQYKWALDQLFYKHKFNDMEIAPDFFDYFDAGAKLLDQDKSIMAISSRNDNGQRQFVHDPYVLYRSDFFPGLGWMLSRSTWDELSPKWPKAYWDDWLRLKENHAGRQFIRPEVCRTYNFGEHGSSMGQFFKQYLEPIKLNDVQVDWKSMDLSYLEEDKYVEHFGSLLKNSTPVHVTDAILKAHNINGDIRIVYRDQSDFEGIARQFGIFEEWKDGIPRTA
ncbi:hypothetical protein CASFOL_033149 [Castilleja foliolosa]|uniref:Alpha-1,3-mannosyl-glycoprotein 2-beta-N-acetylglucosaminyltransferase n=1 Tax=Castilleja foliolosa TaxID=1961234 RepID=A0ABD3C4F9_9LAMI